MLSHLCLLTCCCLVGCAPCLSNASMQQRLPAGASPLLDPPACAVSPRRAPAGRIAPPPPLLSCHIPPALPAQPGKGNPSAELQASSRPACAAAVAAAARAARLARGCRRRLQALPPPPSISNSMSEHQSCQFTAGYSSGGSLGGSASCNVLTSHVARPPRIVSSTQPALRTHRHSQGGLQAQRTSLRPSSHQT